MISGLPRREREIFEILCSAGEATAAGVRERMIDPPSYSAVRTLLGRLEGRGLVTHSVADQAFVYRSVPQADAVKESALHQLVRNFFNGSAASAATALVGLSRSFDPGELEALERAIEDARERDA